MPQQRNIWWRSWKMKAETVATCLYNVNDGKSPVLRDLCKFLLNATFPFMTVTQRTLRHCLQRWHHFYIELWCILHRIAVPYRFCDSSVHNLQTTLSCCCRCVHLAEIYGDCVTPARQAYNRNQYEQPKWKWYCISGDGGCSPHFAFVRCAQNIHD